MACNLDAELTSLLPIFERRQAGWCDGPVVNTCRHLIWKDALRILSTRYVFFFADLKKGVARSNAAVGLEHRFRADVGPGCCLTALRGPSLGSCR